MSIWDSGMRPVDHAAAPAPRPAAPSTPSLPSYGYGATVAQSLLVTGCEFSGQSTLLTLAMGEAKSGGYMWGRQKNTWHAEAAC